MANNYPQPLAALPTTVPLVRSDYNALQGCFDGSVPARIKVACNDDQSVILQCPAAQTETTTNRLLVVLAKAGTVKFSVTAGGDVVAVTLNVSGATTLTGNVTFGGNASVTGTLGVTGLTTLSGGVTVTAPLTIPTAAGAAPTALGDLRLNTTPNQLVWGDGASTHTSVDTASSQVLANKTLTAPTIADYTNAQHSHAAAGAPGGQVAHSNLSGIDTDTGLTALHHTLGTGAFQAAAGNHTHTAGGDDTGVLFFGFSYKTLVSTDATGLSVSATSIFNFVFQWAASLNDYIEWDVLFDAGTYTFTTLGRQNSSWGIAQWKVDGTLVGTAHDWYAVGAVDNKVYRDTGIAVAAGRHTLRYQVTSKNAASAGYQMQNMLMMYTRTGA